MFGNLSKEKMQVSHEGIAVQKNEEEFIRKLERNFADIIEESHKIGDRSWAKSSNRIFTDSFADIDKLLLKRFGVPCKHIESVGVAYACTPIQPMGHSVLAGDIHEKINGIERHLKATKTKAGCEKSECMTSFDTQTTAVFENVLTSHRELTKAMNTKGVVIDNQNAKITGLVPKFHVYYLVDPHELSKMGFTPLEAVAVLFHEVGHVFTHISESYRSVRQVDTFREALEETKDFAPKKRYRILNKRMFGSSAKTVDSEDESVLFMDMHKRLMESTMKPNNVETSVESERMADDFTIKFGLGGELASGLNKLYDPSARGAYLGGYIGDDGFTLISFKTLIVLAVLFGLLSILTMVVMFLFLMAVYIGTISMVVGLIVGGEKSHGKVYDVAYRRMHRVLNGERRILRNTDNDEIITAKRASIKRIESMIAHMPGESFFDSVYDAMPWQADTVNETNISRLLEDGIDNGLHVSSKAWKQDRED